MPFITFEGIDGCGKSTLLRKLSDHLRKTGLDVLETREPGGTKLAEELRALVLKIQDDAPTPRAELLIYEAARAQHVDKLILPALIQNKWVLSDRFYDSSVAYQGGGRHLSIAEIDWLNQFATAKLKPDLTVLLDLDIDVGLARRKDRQNQTAQSADRLELEKREFHQGVRATYLTLARAEPHRFLVLDATHTPDQLFADLVSYLEKKKLL